MSTPSFKQMIKDGSIKRADAMKVRLEDIHEEPGFNLRLEGDDLEESVAALAEHIAAGGQYPALEVRPRAQGGVWVVDGHRRRRALIKADADGRAIRDASGDIWVPVVPFTGNDAERVLRILTSAEQRPLKLLEVAVGYRRLVAFNWTVDQIARGAGKTRQHVEQLLLLANANTDVQRMVEGGLVSASVAVETVRKHGDDAGDVLSQELKKAQATGKKKVTLGTIKGKALPRAIVNDLTQSLSEFCSALPKDAHEVLSRVERGSLIDATVTINASTLLRLVRTHEHAAIVRQEQERRLVERIEKSRQIDLEEHP